MGVENFVDADTEANAQDLIARLLGSLGPLGDRAAAVDPVGGGVLAREDELTAFDPLSAQVSHQLTVALDHLGTLSRHLQSHGLPLTSQFTLARTAIESVGAALWLLTPDRSRTRVIRALRMCWWARVDAAELAKALGARDDRLPRILARLEQLRDIRRGSGDQRIDIVPISTTDLLLEVDRKLKKDEGRLSLLLSWKACSGLAHANKAVAQIFLERRQPEGLKPDEYYATASWAATSVMLGAAVYGLREAVERYEGHAARLN
jgi:hypothetical protein